ncbi:MULTISPECIES: (d)CMP kinase [unclassified Sporosarcina]|uniref:(d)CMP kinase n=1 Tax=unclassified Sporosarcina TaxID=2647733 RepID=UPI00203C0351|nr:MULTISPECIES: (d)CMP kinase [unclassified Sporosarcina]GKV65666.1 cytidylate kinase [Sporosarcina sp. NCCP-2331]GLB55754.1 cytidylate kinase [Sporosarcina sp. NCCP-2378]
MTREMRIAIDGPAAAGKSTIAKLVAKKLGYTYIDTGAMYRAITYKVLQNAVDPCNEEEVEKLISRTQIELEQGNEAQRVLLDGAEVSEAIRSHEVTSQVSAIAALTSVRQLLMKKQQNLAEERSVVMDGRDIGTTVLPDAELKIFMTASVEERAQRRLLEEQLRGMKSDYVTLKREITERDKADSEREISPLKKAEDAIIIDTTGKTIEQVTNMIVEYAEMRLAR